MTNIMYVVTVLLLLVSIYNKFNLISTRRNHRGQDGN